MSRFSENNSGLGGLLNGNHSAVVLCLVAGVAVLLMVIGCEPESSRQKTAAENPELAARVFQSYEQSVAETSPSDRKNVGSEIGFLAKKALDNVGLSKELARDKKWVAVDIEYRLSTDASRQLDLEHIGLVDGDSGKFLSVCPEHIQRLTSEGEPAHSRDPEFDGREEYRCLLLYQVPQACRAVKLDYWNDALTLQPLPLEDEKRVLPHATLKPVAMISREVESDRITYYDVLIECQDWFRVDTPLSCELRSFVESQAVGLHATSFVEVDDQLRPMAVALQDRPFVVPKRRFVVEFRSPQKLIPLDVKVGQETYQLPSKEELDLPLETMTALRPGRQTMPPSATQVPSP